MSSNVSGGQHCAAGQCQGSIGICLQQTLSCKTLGALTLLLSTVLAPSTLFLGDSFSILPHGFTTAVLNCSVLAFLFGKKILILYQYYEQTKDNSQILPFAGRISWGQAKGYIWPDILSWVLIQRVYKSRDILPSKSWDQHMQIWIFAV